MKRLTRFISGLIAAAAVSSCMAFDAEIQEQMGVIQGIVTDMEGTPLNHIKVVLDYGDDLGQLTVYTSLKGEFIADIYQPATMLTITLEDIDGEENGGLFNTLKDQITIIDGNILNNEEISTLEYRLTRATASESTPQSL